MRSGYERAIGRPYTTRWPDPETVTETTTIQRLHGEEF
jgi:hypothetical protein